jgi:transaldolase/glucose-6-phosphate isomerase
MESSIKRLHDLGQSIWYDNIQRNLLGRSAGGADSEFAAMISRGDIRGVTSNPSIFNNAISKTHDYNSALMPLAWSGWKAEPIFWQLAVEDIRKACDLFHNLYKETKGADGFVSLEVNPTLAHDTEATLSEAKRIWNLVDRHNLMVKIPATLEGLPAIKEAIAAGINVNVTLIFSIDRYQQVMKAYLEGLDKRITAGLPVDHVASVASFFVSRIDTKVDNLLPADSPLRGKVAIAYSKLAYEQFLLTFQSDKFAKYLSAGCLYQRPLWASTSTKNTAYPDTLYVNNLIGPDTVNTLPPQTLDAFKDHGKAESTLNQHIEAARKVISDLELLNISMKDVTAALEEEGVKLFADAFEAMIGTIEERRSAAVKSLGSIAGPVKKCIKRMIKANAPARLWSHDATLWTASPAGRDDIQQRLGWLDLPASSASAIEEIRNFTEQITNEGIDRIILLGMGGSSLAAEVLSLVFTTPTLKGMLLTILDSTDPEQVLESSRNLHTEKTIIIVSSKSGGTTEVEALFSYFWELFHQEGSHFVAITDPGTSLEALAEAKGFRKIFLADPSVGGRYSALTHFGLVPAAMVGIDPSILLDRAGWMKQQCDLGMPGERNPGLVLGVILAQAAQEGQDKLTILADDPIAPIGNWLEQLIAESSGKLGKGIIPVVGEPAMQPENYGSDRLFVYLRQDGILDETVKALKAAGHPVLVFNLSDPYDLGAEFYRWEVAAAFACVVLGVNAFDQPDVQDAKDRTKKNILTYSQYNSFNEGTPILIENNWQVFSTIPQAGTSLVSSMEAFLRSANKGDYIAINAFLPRNDESMTVLESICNSIREMTGCATTIGFGPRFLHSTGQLHKGGPDSGIFLQITAEPEKDLEIPGKGVSFGVLERAQSLGDYQALLARGRRIMRVNIPTRKDVSVLLQILEKCKI